MRSSIWAICLIVCLVVCLLRVGLIPRPIMASTANAVIATEIGITQRNINHEFVAAASIAQLVDQAELIVRGRVSRVESIWHAEERQIETVSTIQIDYTILGPQRDAIQVRTAGGFLPDRGFGMISLHAARFVLHEELLLFLGKQARSIPKQPKGGEVAADQWQVIQGAAGKFIVQGATAINHNGLTVEAFEQLLANVAAAPTSHVKAKNTPFFLPYTTKSTHPPSAPKPTLTVKEGKHKWAMPHAGVTYYINLNSRHVDEQVVGKRSSDLRAAIIGAAMRWSVVDSADFTLHYGGSATATTTGYNGISEVLFMRKGANERAAAAEVWYTADLTVVEADIWINDDYVWDTSGKPARKEVDLESALIHEFGHWLILGHLTEPQSVMYPRLTSGSVKRILQAEDIAGISAIYPR